MDNTFATPYLCRPIEWGATIVLHSATKFLGGHGTSIGGIIVESGKFDYSHYPTIADPSPAYHNLKFYETFGHYGFLMKVRAEALRDVGACMSPFNAFLILQGIETLSVRMERHVQNALGAAQFLKAHQRWHMGCLRGLTRPSRLRTCKEASAQRSRRGLLVQDQGERLGPPRGRQALHLRTSQIFSHLANVGDVRSLVIHPASTSPASNSPTRSQRQAGIAPEMIRLSAGLETLDDLLWDLDRALWAVDREK